MQQVRAFRAFRAFRALWDRFFRVRPGSARPPTRLIIGLGNPGSKYQTTRHNVGFRIVELLADRYGAEWNDDPSLDAKVSVVEIAGEDCLLLEPQTFMNRSGTAISAALERWPGIDPKTDLLIVVDDLDLPTGRIRLRLRGGGGGHRGLGDILRILDTTEIPRLRFGIGRPGDTQEVIDWVLAPFANGEESSVLPEALSRAVDAIETAIRDGVTDAMGQFNARS